MEGKEGFLEVARIHEEKIQRKQFDKPDSQCGLEVGLRLVSDTSWKNIDN